MPKQDLLEYVFSDIILPENANILDVGCNSAKTLCYIKNKFHIQGEVIGIDKMSKNFEDEEWQKESGIQLLSMDASQPLAFPDGHFDCIFHKDTLECITDIDVHIRELHRLLKPGGFVICIHRDWESMAINGYNKTLINKVIYEYANFLQSGWMNSCDGWIGRRLYGYFHASKAFKGEIDCFTEVETDYVEGTRGYNYSHEMRYFIGDDGFLTQTEYDEWIDDLTKAYNQCVYLFSAPFYIYKGIKV